MPRQPGISFAHWLYLVDEQCHHLCARHLYDLPPRHYYKDYTSNCDPATLGWAIARTHSSHRKETPTVTTNAISKSDIMLRHRIPLALWIRLRHHAQKREMLIKDALVDALDAGLTARGIPHADAIINQRNRQGHE